MKIATAAVHQLIDLVINSDCCHAAGKAKASALTAMANETLPASADIDPKNAAPCVAAPQPPSHQAHQANGHTSTESLSLGTAQPSAAPQESTHKSPDGVSTSQSSPSDPADRPNSPPAASGHNTLASCPQSPVQSSSQPQSASEAPVQHLPSPVPSTLASSPRQSPRPRSAAFEADSVPEASSAPVPASVPDQSSRAQSPLLQNRPSQSPSSQQAFSQQLRAALTPAGKPPAQTHSDCSPQKQSAQPPATPKGQQPLHLSGVPSSSAHSPAAQDPAASPQRSHLLQPAGSSRPGSATSSQSASVMSDMTNAMMRPAPASPGFRLGHTRQPDSAGAAGHSPRPTAASSQQPIDRRAAAAAAAAAAALTGPPKGSTAAAHVPQPRPTSSVASHFSPPPSARGASPFEQAAATLPPLAAVGKGKQASSPDDKPADVQSHGSPQGEAAVPTSPPVTTPVRKPPGLPSPVPAVHGQGSADLDSVISSDRWPDQVSTKSETSSNPRSPKKGIKVPAVVPPLPLPTASASASAAVSEAMSGTPSEDGFSLGDQQSISSSQLDQSAAAIAIRLEREREQQRKQEAKHLISKQRAAQKRQQQIADQDRRQQEEHAWRAEQKAKAQADKAALTAPGLHPPVSAPFNPPVSGMREPREVDRPRRGPRDRDFDDTASQQAPKSYPTAGVRHVPAHAGPRHGSERHGSRPPAYGPPDSDHGSDYGSDLGGSEHEFGFGRSQGKGRVALPDRSVRGGRGADRMPVQGIPLSYWSRLILLV